MQFKGFFLTVPKEAECYFHNSTKVTGRHEVIIVPGGVWSTHTRIAWIEVGSCHATLVVKASSRSALRLNGLFMLKFAYFFGKSHRIFRHNFLISADS